MVNQHYRTKHNHLRHRQANTLREHGKSPIPAYRHVIIAVAQTIQNVLGKPSDAITGSNMRLRPLIIKKFLGASITIKPNIIYETFVLSLKIFVFILIIYILYISSED